MNDSRSGWLDTGVIDRLHEDARLQAPGGTLEQALYQLKLLRREVDLERVLRDRWWATFNAAVGIQSINENPCDIVYAAERVANKAHGQLADLGRPQQ